MATFYDFWLYLVFSLTFAFIYYVICFDLFCPPKLLRRDFSLSLCLSHSVGWLFYILLGIPFASLLFWISCFFESHALPQFKSHLLCFWEISQIFLFDIGAINYFWHLFEVISVFMFLPYLQLHFGRGQVNVGIWLVILNYFEIIVCF